MDEEEIQKIRDNIYWECDPACGDSIRDTVLSVFDALIDIIEQQNKEQEDE